MSGKLWICWSNQLVPCFANQLDLVDLTAMDLDSVVCYTLQTCFVVQKRHDQADSLR